MRKFGFTIVSYAVRFTNVLRISATQVKAHLTVYISETLIQCVDGVL